MITCLIANVYRDTSKRAAPFEVTDFMPNYHKEPEKQLTEGETFDAIAEFAKMMGAQVEITNG